MSNRLFFGILAACLIAGFTTAGPATAGDPVAFVKTHCVKCHGPEKQAGDVRLDDLPDPAKSPERWLAVRNQVRDGLMPPSKEPPVDPTSARDFVSAVTQATGAKPSRLPNEGNLIPHDLLFGSNAPAPAPSPPRVWRLSPDGYMRFIADVHRGRVQGIVQPFTLTPERGIKDYAGLYSIDDASTEILVRNAEMIVNLQSDHTFKDGKLQGKNDTVREFVALMDPKKSPSRAELETAVRTQYRMAIGRTPSAGELARFLALYEKCAADGDRPAAVKTMLQAVLLKTDVLYRSEMGRPAREKGLLVLDPQELERALHQTLGTRRNLNRKEPIARAFEKAADNREALRKAVAAEVQALFDDPKNPPKRIPGFFHEYFEYHRAGDVFKDKPKEFVHVPNVLISDTDRLVELILAEDKDVFRQLLTTEKTFANYGTKKNKQTRKDEPAPAVVLNPNNDKGKVPPEFVYGFKEWPKDQPTANLPETRIGILMQPSWLAAWSTNFDNDPVRRGRWIRERLLGGTVPDLPIGVAAQVPDDPHRTYRDRLTVTRAAQCWKCHRKMDELGLAFEQFDHYGRFRTVEPVLDEAATAKNVDKKGKPLGPVYKDAPLVTTGLIADTGDPKLDGPVKDPREMIRRIANSDRARQVFVRHAFRYFLGRNETLSDARTLQEADREYVKSGGSFKTLVRSLLTSDSFLYRSPGGTPSVSSGDRK